MPSYRTQNPFQSLLLHLGVGSDGGVLYVLAWFDVLRIVLYFVPEFGGET